MGEFLDVVLGFPTALFTFPLIVVAAYWVVVLCGGTEADTLDTDVGGLPGIAAVLGLGGVPVAVALSLLVVSAWFTALVGTVLLGGALPVLVLVLAVAIAWLATRLAVLPLRRLLPEPVDASRRAFVGRPCVIRTGTVSTDFGQAEVTADDGSTAIVQVRQTGRDTFTAGGIARIYDYDPDGEFFWVVPNPDLPTLGQRDH